MLQALNVCHGSRNLTFQVWRSQNILQRLSTSLKRLVLKMGPPRPPSLVYTIHFLSPSLFPSIKYNYNFIYIFPFNCLPQPMALQIYRWSGIEWLGRPMILPLQQRMRLGFFCLWLWWMIQLFQQMTIVLFRHRFS